MMFYLGEHLASHGYVVVGIDHTDSTNADIQQESDRGPGIISTFYNRARDQQFILDYFSQLPRQAITALPWHLLSIQIGPQLLVTRWVALEQLIRLAVATVLPPIN